MSDKALKNVSVPQPSRRFAEFKDRSSWDLKQFADLYEFKPTNNLSREELGYDAEGIRNIHYGDIHTKYSSHLDVSRKTLPTIANAEFIATLRQRAFCEKGDLVFADASEDLLDVGKCVEIADIGEHKVVAGMHTILATRLSKEPANGFAGFLFQTSYVRSQIRKYAQGTKVSGISPKRLAQVNLPVPVDQDEQKKIADCLTALDRLIAAHRQRLDALRDYKKALLQNLFPRQGESVPRLRFQSPSHATGWAMVPLGEIAHIQLGKMLDSKKEGKGRLLPYLNNQAVRWNDFDLSNLPLMHFDDKEYEKFELRYGDVLVCEGGEPGRAAIWDCPLQDVKYQKAIHRVRFKIPYEPQLLVAYLEAIANTSRLERHFTGSGIKHLTRENFSLLEVPLPKISEQRRLSSCLSSLEQLLANGLLNLKSLEAYREGLLQSLFPSKGRAYSFE